MSFQASFKNESLILKWKDDSNENLILTLFYKHENDENWSDAILKDVRLDNDSSEYSVEYTFLNARPGRYNCQIQSKCCFGVSGMSGKIFAYKEKEVTSVFLFSAIHKDIQNPVKHLGWSILKNCLTAKSRYFCKIPHLICLKEF